MELSTSNVENAIEHDIREYDQWICWKYSKGKKKVPINILTGKATDAQNRYSWSSYEHAVVASRQLNADGIGFVLTKDDPFTVIDLDHVINPDTGEIQADAQAILESLDTYCEISPSLTGLHMILIGEKSTNKCKGSWNGLEIEVYSEERFITITGITLDSEVIEYRQAGLDWLCANALAPQPQTEDKHSVLSKRGTGFQGSDKELLSKMRNAGKWKSFRQLYDHGNTFGYPSLSEADQALCGILAFWVGPDEERIAEWYYESKLAENLYRKVDSQDYLQRTIIKAIEGCFSFYDPQYNTSEVIRNRITEVMSWILTYSWKGRSGPTDRDVFRVLLRVAWKYGKVVDGGIEVSASDRQLVLDAGLGSNNTARNAVMRLAQKHNLLERINTGGRGRAASYLIKRVDRANLHHNQNYCVYYDAPLRGIPITTKMRNSSSISGYYSTLGKRSMQVLELIHESEEPITSEALNKFLGTNRARDIERRNISRLLKAGLIEFVEGGYATVEDVEIKLARFLKESGCDEMERLVRERQDRQREAYQNNCVYPQEYEQKTGKGKTHAA